MSLKCATITRQAIIQQTVNAINQLPGNKAEEISDFADFVIKRYEEHQLTQGIQTLTVKSNAFDFLNYDEDLYSESDLKEMYNG